MLLPRTLPLLLLHASVVRGLSSSSPSPRQPRNHSTIWAKQTITLRPVFGSSSTSLLCTSDAILPHSIPGASCVCHPWTNLSVALLRLALRLVTMGADFDHDWPRRPMLATVRKGLRKGQAWSGTGNCFQFPPVPYPFRIINSDKSGRAGTHTTWIE